jgi:hypothetical protein
MATKLTKAVEKNAGNDAITKMTFSAWIKRSKLGEAEIFSAHQLSTYYTDFYFNSDNALILYSYINSSTAANVVTKRTFVDTNCWYHIMLVVDTTLATTNDRIKFYVNGVRETEMDGSQTHPAQNSAFGQFSDTGATLCLGDNPNRTAFEGAISHVHYTPYTAYDASAFGSTDSNGVWKINTGPSVNYSTAGFFILKDNNGVTDQSGQSNNFTVASGTLTTLKDNPSNVFATINPLTAYHGDKAILEYVNTEVAAATGGSAKWYGASTMAFTKGKFYCEVKNITTSNPSLSVGISMNPSRNQYENHAPGARNSDIATENYSGNIVINNSNVVTGYMPTWSGSGDICMIAVDADNNKFYIGKNGVWADSDNPSTGTGGYDMSSVANHDESTPFYHFSFGSTSGSYMNEFSVNFGNGYFGTTAISTNSGNGYSGAEGKSKFNYSVPTGFSALCTEGLNQ